MERFPGVAKRGDELAPPAAPSITGRRVRAVTVSGFLQVSLDKGNTL